jgi:adenosylhomocysteine nucleosidase
VAREDEKHAIFASTGAIALDMESAAVARIAQRFHKPFLAIRSIIDPADATIPPSIENAFDENGMLHVPKMLLHAAMRPTDFVAVIRLGRHFGAAMKTLRLAAAIGRETHFAAA